MGNGTRNAEEIASQARSIASLEQRRAFLDGACHGDDQMRERVEAMIATRRDDSRDKAPTPCDATLDSDIQGPLQGNAPIQATEYQAPPIKLGPGATVGAYKVLQEIGAGGMGAVYMAEQQRPVRRKVALKIIKPGMDSQLVIARFEAERQALALMNHHHIARVLDAGTTDAGLPYFVMELVHGVPISDYCEQNKLGLEDRLQLFIPICQAIQHAHQKGIIHRDIKPSNILVTMHDGQPVPKVIDFGIAKAIGQQLTERTMYTQLGQMIGTLEYMSPEQAEMSGLDIDTRSDIYSLGVLLYEMLTGTTPLARDRIKTAGFDEVRRLIREEEPARPSTRLSGSLDTGEAAAVRRHAGAHRMNSLLRRELDWIAMKALEKDRTRRYDTAAALAADVQRFLNDEPVAASPPSTAYRLQKFVRRNRAAVGTATLLVAILVAAVAVSSWQAVRATMAQQTAEQARLEAERHREEAERQRTEADAQREEAETQRKEAEAQEQRAVEALEKAETERAISRAVNEFVNEDLLQVSPLLGKKQADIDLRSVIDLAAQTVGERFVDQPLAEAEVRLTLGQSFSALGDYDAAEGQLLRARQIREMQLGEDAPESLLASNELLKNYLNASDLQMAEPLAPALQERARDALGEHDPITLTAKRNLGVFLARKTLHREAEQVLLELLKTCRTNLGNEDLFTAEVAASLAAAFLNQKRLNEAEQLLKEVAATREEALGPDHPTTLISRTNLGMLYGERKQFANAQRELRAVLEGTRQLLGREHPTSLQIERNLVWWLMEGQELEPIEKLREEAVAELGPTDDHTLMLAMVLADGYTRAGGESVQSAIDLLESTLQLCERELGAGADMTAETKFWLGRAYGWRGDNELAKPFRREAYRHRLAKYGPGHEATHQALGPYCGTLVLLGEHDQAISVAEEYLSLCRDQFGNEHRKTAIGILVLARCYAERDPGRHEELLQEALAIFRSTLDGHHKDVRQTIHAVANLLMDQDRFEEAEPLLREQIAIIKQNQMPGAGNCSLRLVECLLGQDKFDESKQALEEACSSLDTVSSLVNQSHRDKLRDQVDRVVALYEAAGREPDIDRWRERAYRLCEPLTVESDGP